MVNADVPAKADETGVDPDSRASTHLANERTFFAWLRTGMSLMALGVASAQFLRAEDQPGATLIDWMALALIGGGIVMVLAGAAQSRRAMRAIEAGMAVASTGAIIFGTALLVLVGVLAIGFVALPQ